MYRKTGTEVRGRIRASVVRGLHPFSVLGGGGGGVSARVLCGGLCRSSVVRGVPRAALCGGFAAVRLGLGGVAELQLVRLNLQQAVRDMAF